VKDAVRPGTLAVVGEIRIGCSGWSYRDWRGVLYPPGLPAREWLPRYAEVFDTVEVNSTFYRLVREETVETWAAATPPDFLFCVKASRYLTHMRRLADMDRGLRRFETPLRPLGDKRGPTLWQLPERAQRDDAQLATWLDALPEGRHALEVRHQSWMDPEVLELLRWHGVALVIGDHPARRWQPLELTTDWTLVRMHYGARGRRGNYSETELDEWADRVAVLAEEADVLVYFNNDWEGFAVRNALGLARRLGVQTGVLATR
jgi:uncharacterized protein YecE (DUF72 family)